MNFATQFRLCAAAAVFGCALTVLPALGQATTYNFIQTTEGCTGGCGTDPLNKVQVSDTTTPNGNTALGAGIFDIYVTLDQTQAFNSIPWSFQKNDTDKQNTGHFASFAFSSTLSLTSSSVTFINPLTGFATESKFPVSATDLPAQMSPWLFPGNAYGLSTPDQQTHSILDFRLDTNSTINLATFIGDLKLGTGDSNHPDIFFAADAYSGKTGKTGIIGFTFSEITTSRVETPLPAALPLFASGLAGFGLYSWRRKRKYASALPTY